MFIAIDLTSAPPSVALHEPSDCKRFHVAVRGEDEDGVRHALADSGVGTVDAEDDDHVWVSVDAVRRLAAGQVAPGWDDEFAGMLAYAASKGWMNADGTSIRAHREVW